MAANTGHVRAEDNVFTHGTYAGYNRWKCRCDDCRRVNSQRRAVHRARQRQRAAEIEPDRLPVTAGAVRSPDLAIENSWLEYAECRWRGNPADFFPENGDYRAAARAREICADCKVRELCAEWALTAVVVNADGTAETFVEGIVGGTSQRERQTLRKERGIKKVGRTRLEDQERGGDGRWKS